MNFADLAPEYARLWAQAAITPKFDAAAQATAKKILASRDRYEAIESATGVPWYVVGVIHAMESGCRFSTHLHNGDPLTARTKLVPAGRPLQGKAPFTWEESACDALLMKNLQQITDWSVARICYELERYNGWGYRKYHPTTLSPYLWSGTQHYSKGKYVADGKWSATAVSGQTGAVALLKRLAEIEPSITCGEAPAKAEPAPAPEVAGAPEIVPATYPKADPRPVVEAVKQSKTIWGALVALLGTIIAWLEKGVAVLLDAAQHVTSWAPIQGLFATAGANVKSLGLGLVVAGVVLVITRRLKAAAEGKIG